MDFGPMRRKRLWYTAAVGSVAGVASLAAVAAVPRATGPGLRSDTLAVASSKGTVRTVADVKQGGEAKGDDDGVVRVPCDVDKLLRAITLANDEDGGTLKLADDCTYSLTDPVDQVLDGLPPIHAPITIIGEGSTIERAVGNLVPNFRIFEVQTGGDLTLCDLTVKFGVGDGLGGGGLLVRGGGKATLKETTFAYNRSVGSGGAIANYGITEVLGKSDHHKDGADDEWSKWSDEDWSSHADGWGSLIARNSTEQDGGGIYSVGSLKVEKTRITFNNAPGSQILGSGEGGGLKTDNGAVTEVRRSLVDNNQSSEDAGGVDNDGSTTSISYSLVANNSTTGEGGGLENEDGSLYLQYTGVRGNTSAGVGGGVHNSNGKFVADRSEISGNTSLPGGGGLYNEGQISVAVLRDSEVERNRSINQNGAGIWNDTLSQLHLVGTEVSKNVAKFAPGGIQNFNPNAGTDVTVDNESSITDNRPTNCVGSAQAVPNCFG